MAFFIAIPALLLRDRMPGEDPFTKTIAAIVTTAALWICYFYFISFLGLTIISGGIFILTLCIILIVISRPSIKLMSRWMLLGFSVLTAPYLFGYFFSGMLPGSDSAMHGYITRLIIEKNGLPDSYMPLLPDDSFGAYSAGFHLMAAIASSLEPQWLMDGLSFATALSYVIAICGLVFVLTLVVPIHLALPVGLVAFWFHRSLHYVVNWGGSPSVLSLGFVLVALAFFGYALRQRSYFWFMLGSACWSAAALTHLIPAYIGFYLILVVCVYWILEWKVDKKFVLKSALIGITAIACLLAPFLMQANAYGSEQLSSMIFTWQQRMLDHAIRGDFVGDISRLLSKVKFDLSDLTLVATTASLLWLIFRGRWRQVMLPFYLFFLFIILIWNSGYWVLPMSELVYPERVIYFFILPCAWLMAFATAELEVALRNQMVFIKYVLAISFVVVGIQNCFDRYAGCIVDSGRHYDSEVQAGFGWLARNTDADAVVHVTNHSEGIWVPALSYRAAVGTHVHFIHLVDSVMEKLNVLPVDHFELVFDSSTEKPIRRDSLADYRVSVFKNSQVEIFQTRDKP